MGTRGNQVGFLSRLYRAARVLVYAPLYALDWERALKAGEAQQWLEVERRISRMHRFEMCDGPSRLWLSVSLLHQRRYEEALEELERIKEPLATAHEEGSKNVTHALALYNLGRLDEAVELLRNTISEDWRPQDLKKASDLLRGSGHEGQ